ncbi:MAG TPA: type VI secretion system tip protein TssI/VgrG [Micropepsaceae bacterium]
MAGLEDIELDQNERLISVESFHLGKKKILITAFSGTERLSALSRFQLEIMTIGRALDPGEILGKPITLALRIKDQVRKFSGIAGRFQTVQTSIRDYNLHIVELVPPAWLLSLNQRCKIFPDKKATDVVSQVLKAGGVNVKEKTAGTSREYIVQYCESDFNFISRLLEDEGLFFYFDHGDPNCPIVLGNGSADYSRAGLGALEFTGCIQEWEPQYQVGANAFEHADWDFKAVKTINGTSKGLAKVQAKGIADRSVYEYPGRYGTADEATAWARARMEEHEAGAVKIRGTTADIRVQPASKFKTKDYKLQLPGSTDATDSYVFVSVEHRARDGSGVPFEAPTSYENNFECIPADLNFRPARVSHRPAIAGPQTALVTDGPDEYGRAKVKFPWEQQGQSRWTRVAQNWAFNQMGTQFLPRINSEVVVEFLDGDPDQPLIVGMVYNGKNKLPFAVPANKTQSGIRGSNWDAAGTANKSNELRFEDKSGSEEIFVHAQKDFKRVVVNDDSLTVEQGNRTLETKTGNVTETLSKGNHSLKVDAGTSKVEAMQSITLKVGSNSVVIDQQGITIKGIMIKIEGSAMANMKSPMTEVDGDGMLTLKGGITMIN